MTASRLNSLCGALLVLNLIYCAAAVFIDALPGWKMFETVAPLTYRLSDARGYAVDVPAALPLGAHLIDQAQLRRVVSFICQHHTGPLWFEPARGVQGRWLNAGHCDADAQR